MVDRLADTDIATRVQACELRMDALDVRKDVIRIGRLVGTMQAELALLKTQTDELFISLQREIAALRLQSRNKP